MTSGSLPVSGPMLRQALTFMQSALELLDRAQAPEQIGARLDHAICELQDTISAAEPPSDSETLRRSA